ncbi:MAG: DUF2235 domain-containing protein [Actinomycetota bacterium]
MLLFDGTWNTPESNTNIHRLEGLIARRDDAGVEQIVQYDEGVGTGRFDRVRGGLFGLGLSENVREWYRWICENYQEDDELYLFGFSRGAYTARSLAGLIAQCGLVAAGEPGSKHDAAWEKYSNDGRGLDGERKYIDIEFLGVFDTVGALGVPMGPIRSRFTRKGTLFHRTTPSVRYKGMFQALAIDENRKAFRASLWTRYAHADLEPEPLKDDQSIEQRWFVGAHTNVGGGYAHDPLPDPPLQWMMDKAAECGLAFTDEIELDGAEHRGEIVDSFKKFAGGLYWLSRLGRRFWRSIGAEPRPVKTRKTGQGGRSFSINESIDGSVFDRIRDVDGYAPDALVEWADREGKRLEELRGPQNIGTWL